MSSFTSSFNAEPLRRLLKKLGVLLLGFLLVFAIVSYLYGTSVIRSIDLFKKKMKPLSNPDRTVKLVFLGDSHPGGGIKQRFLPDKYVNLGFPALNLRDQYLQLKWVHNNHPELEYVVLQADFHIFGPLSNRRDSPGHLLPYSTYRNVKEVYDLSYFELLRQIVYHHAPLLNPRRRFSLPKFFYRYVQSLKQGKQTVRTERFWLDKHNDLNYMETFRWDQASQTEKRRAVKKRIQRHFGSSNSTVNLGLVEALRNIQTYTRRHDLKIINIRYPVTEMYLERVPFTPSEKELFRRLFATPNSVLNLNFARAYQTQGEYFRNSDHLNYAGARALTNDVLKAFQQHL